VKSLVTYACSVVLYETQATYVEVSTIAAAAVVVVANVEVNAIILQQVL
jgi:hypothetical protein